MVSAELNYPLAVTDGCRNNYSLLKLGNFIFILFYSILFIALLIVLIIELLIILGTQLSIIQFNFLICSPDY